MQTFIGVVLIVLGGGFLFGTFLDEHHSVQQLTIDSQRRTIEAMDRTIRSQWELQRILQRRLGEPVPPPPVSITGLPEPKEE